MSCSSCLEIKMPECVDTISIDGLFDAGTDYLVVFDNHFGKKTILNKTSSVYTGIIDIDVTEDLGVDYFFRGNTYTLKVYATKADLECDLPMNLCVYNTCISLVVYEAEGMDETFTINCCE